MNALIALACVAFLSQTSQPAEPPAGAYLGVTAISLESEIRSGKRFPIKHARGLIISDVDRDSPAELAGLKVGDIITSVNMHPVTQPHELWSMLHDCDPSAELKIHYYSKRTQLRNYMTVPVQRAVYDRSFVEISNLAAPDFIVAAKAAAEENPDVANYLQECISWYDHELSLKASGHLNYRNIPETDLRSRGPVCTSFSQSYPPKEGRIGYVGRNQIRGRMNNARVVQVLDEMNCLVTIEFSIDEVSPVVWVQDVPTKGMTSEAEVIIPVLLKVDGTTTYPTLFGTRTVLVLKPFNVDPVRHLFPRNTLRR